MAMFKYTPKPWIFDPNINIRSFAVTAGKTRICACRWINHNKKAIDEARANATLIAAAPDLLEALVLLKQVKNGDEKEIDHAQSIASEAITKATKG